MFKVVGDWAEELGRLVGGFIDAFLAVLEVESHVVELKLAAEDLLHPLRVLNLPHRPKDTRRQELILRVVEKVHARKHIGSVVQDADCEELSIEPV